MRRSLVTNGPHPCLPAGRPEPFSITMEKGAPLRKQERSSRSILRFLSPEKKISTFFLLPQQERVARRAERGRWREVAPRGRCEGWATSKKHGGYILLISILVIGAICSAILSSLLMLGINAGQVSFTVTQSNQSLALAQGCAEYALQQLRTSPAYLGNELLTYPTGTCDILGVGGSGNNNRFICTEGQVGDVVRRLEIVVNQVLPQTAIYSWQEVAVFSLCE